MMYLKKGCHFAVFAILLFVFCSHTWADEAGFTIEESEAYFRTTEPSDNLFTLVRESGSSDNFTVVLTASPDANVVLNFTGNDTGEVSVSPPSRTITPLNWSSNQIVKVTGVDGTLKDDQQTATITISVDDESSDDAYNATADKTVAVTIIDKGLYWTGTVRIPCGQIRPTGTWDGYRRLPVSSKSAVMKILSLTGICPLQSLRSSRSLKER